MHGAVEALAGERLLVDRAVGVAVEEAADAVFELDDAVGRIVHQRPGEFLVVEELAAFDRVVEMLVEGVGRVEHAVVAALDHARAADLADEAFHGDDDLETRQISCACMAASSPAPPAPRIRMSASRVSKWSCMLGC